MYVTEIKNWMAEFNDTPPYPQIHTRISLGRKP
jgi:hypothetical protein